MRESGPGISDTSIQCLTAEGLRQDAIPGAIRASPKCEALGAHRAWPSARKLLKGTSIRCWKKDKFLTRIFSNQKLVLFFKRRKTLGPTFIILKRLALRSVKSVAKISGF